VAEAARPSTGHRLATEFKREQLEVISPPQTTLHGQLDAIMTGRAIADAAASSFGARAVALSTCPWPLTSSLVAEPRYRRMADRFGATAVEQLTCGFHVHVAITSPGEGVAALDRARVWLPLLLAMSANSPFWMGADTGYASYRYQAWSRWPTAGPSDVFGSIEGYKQHRSELLASGVPLDEGMLYFDARLSARCPTVEVRVADVCLIPQHATALATIIRALIETSVRQWRAGQEPPRVAGSVLKAWSWHASRFGMEEDLVSPLTGKPTPSIDVVGELLDFVGPVLKENGEHDAVVSLVNDIVDSGTGAERQRECYRSVNGSRSPRNLEAIVLGAIQGTDGNHATHPHPKLVSSSAGETTMRAGLPTTRQR